MSNAEKCFTRPKVRFSKSAESPEKLSFDRADGKPKIRSVTNLSPRVKILRAPATNKDFEQSSSPDEIPSRRSGGDDHNDARLCPSKTTSLSTPRLTEIVLTPENRSSNIRASSDKIETCKTLTSPDILPKTFKDTRARKPSSATNDGPSSLNVPKKSFSSLPDKISKPLDKDRPAWKSSARTKTPGSGKENVPSREPRTKVVLKVPENTPRTESTTKSTTSQSSKAKIVENSSRRGVTKKPIEKAIKSSTAVRKVVKPSSDIGVTRKTGDTTIRTSTETKQSSFKSRPIGLMACMKSGKLQSKSAPMKKTILRDASAGPAKVYVGPGLPRTRTPELTIHSKNEILPRSRSEIHSGDKLARPEYNSIVCTIKKLREAREDKIVQDLEHLPAIYRRLVNGKVSSALDFGANEAIYRDLVDLNIDEKQLPSRLTRSKDPEPRRRDIAPKLSDFFVPTNEDEYRRAVLVRPPSPRVLDTWNPYKISDRIFSWKESLDHDL